jgi:polysaccharide biosynthesis/export protein
MVAVAVSLTACAATPARSTVPGPPAHAVAVPPAPAVAAPSANAPLPPPDSSVAALNQWILGSAAPKDPDDDLPLGPGDLIVVSVFLVSELSQLSVRIPANGSIALPIVGILPAAGRTARQLEAEIGTRLQRYMHDPQVSVFIQEHRSQQIAVFGAVRSSGVYPLVSRLRVTDALALAGALNEDADHVVYLIRRAPTAAGGVHAAEATAAPAGRPDAQDDLMIAIDLESVTRDGADLNLPLQAGDVIHVPRAGSFYVGGDVVRPGAFVLKGKTSLHQAIVSAGGVKPTADWNDVRVYRPRGDGQSEVLKFSLKALEKAPGSSGVHIQKNDVVIVGNSALKSVATWFLSNFVRFGIGASIPF